jgi:hypothetical protein
MKTVNETYITNSYCFVWNLLLNDFQQGIHSLLPYILKMASPGSSFSVKFLGFKGKNYKQSKNRFQPTNNRTLNFYILWLNILSSTRYNEKVRNVKKQLIFS